MQKTDSMSKRWVGLLSSRGFFVGILLVFLLQAAWIALSGRYPMAFDEDFHLGIIRLYAHHISPFLNGQPAGANAFGAVARDPSYLYQYLMSFPYRLIHVFTNDQTVQVLWLRAINILLFSGGLVIYRRLLLKTGASRAIVHGCLLIFILLPVVPFLAAQINYDNLFIPLTGLTLLTTVNFTQELSRYKRINMRLLLEIFILCLLTSLVKYAFLPIFGAIIVYLLWMILRTIPVGHKLWLNLGFGLTLMTRRRLMVLIVLFIASGALFLQRYGVNLIRYGTPVPACNQVLSVRACSAYGPWIRDYNFSINKIDEERGPLVYMGDWGYGMWLRIMFTLGGPTTNYETRGPLLVPALVTIIGAVAGTIMAAIFIRRVFRHYNSPVLWLFVLTAAFYIVALWLDDYRSYVRTAQPVAINGRYLFPILLPIFIVVALSFNEALRRRPALKPALLGVGVIGLLWGGGALTFILRSDAAWYWPNSTVQSANRAVQQAIGPVTPGYVSPTQFLR